LQLALLVGASILTMNAFLSASRRVGAVPALINGEDPGD
jgi:hypothetical protein